MKGSVGEVDMAAHLAMVDQRRIRVTARTLVEPEPQQATGPVDPGVWEKRFFHTNEKSGPDFLSPRSNLWF
jgi:hypothetical protein